MKYRVQVDIIETVQVDIEVDDGDASKIQVAAKEKCKKEYGSYADKYFEVVEWEKLPEPLEAT